MELQEIFENFMSAKRLAGLADKSLYNYDLFIHSFVNFIGSQTSLSDLTQERVNRYISMLYDKPISRATLATYIRNLKVFLRWIEKKYGLSFSAREIVIPRTPKKLLRIYSDDEIFLIFKTIKVESPWLTARNKAIVSVMLDSGLRQNEVCTIKRCDISLADRMVKVFGKGSKERIVPLGSLSAHYIQDYLNLCPYDSIRLFVSRTGKELTCNAVKHMMFSIQRKLPFEFSSHKLRHNFATNYCIDQYEKTGQIDIYKLMLLMGQEDIETTRVYLHHANQIIVSKMNISHLDKVFFGEN